MKPSRTDWKYSVDTLMVLCLLGIILIGLLMAFVIPEGRLGDGQSKYFLGLHRHQWGAIHLYLSLAFAALAIVHIVLAWSWIKGKAGGLFGKGRTAALALTALAALAVPFVFWLATSKNDPAYAEFGTGRGRQSLRIGEPARSLPEHPPATGPVAGPGAPPIRAAMPALDASAEPGKAKAVPEEGHGDRTVAGRMEAGTAEVVITGQMTLREVARATGIAAGDIAARLGLPAGASADTTIGRLRKSYGFEMQGLRDAVSELLEGKRRLPAV
jgi:hypothetical protein